MGKRAIVLGGGGARGPYQIGAWRALRELGVTFSIVTGSSVGALNGALMVQGDYETARNMWLNLTLSDVVAQAPEAEGVGALLTFIKRVALQGGLDVSPLEQQVRTAVDERRVRESPVEMGLVTAQFPLLKPVQLLKEEIPEGALVDYLLASSAWFPFFRRRNIGGVDYIDGAYADNMPAELAAQCGAEEIIAIDLQGVGIVHTFRHDDIPVRHIRSHWSLGDMLVFDPAQAARNLQLGYQDGLKAFRRLEGNAYAFALGDTHKNVILLHTAIESIRRRTGVDLFKQRNRLPRIQEMLRYRSTDSRFLHRHPENPTLGRAVTTAAEITGELLQIPPDQIYRLRTFNKLLLERAAKLNLLPVQREHDLFFADTVPAQQLNRRSRSVLSRMLKMLRVGYEGGAMNDAFWRMAAVCPVEFVAANYLLALELHYQRI